MNPPQIENFMKTVLRPLLVAFVLMATMLSCNKEEVFVEPTADTPIDTTTPTDSTNTDGTTPPEDTVDPAASTTPCDFTLDGIQSGDTVVIDCVLDLQGQTVNLPPNVTIVYEGGDIINGTLNFADNSVVSGELLNASVTLSGSKPQLKDTTFEFDPERWGIVQGVVPQSIANSNREILHSMILMAKDLGVTTFKIDKLDAYFYGQSLMEYPIELPSNFNLEMTNNTHLRAFLNSQYTTFLMILDQENITVSGGNLHGYRDQSGNNDGNGNFDYLIKVKTGQNITIDNVSMSYAAEDGLSVESSKHAYEANYVPSKNVLIKGCTFDASGRNNLSIVDGQDIIVEDCNFLNAGIDTPYSNGQAPRYAIDIEPVGQVSTQPLQKVDRVIIRNNIESGSAAGGIIVADGDDILISGNTFETGIGMTGASNVTIENNNVTEIGIGEIDAYSKSRNKNTIVHGNTIKNGSVGITVINQDVQIFDNQIVNCSSVGIFLNSITDAHIYNNTIENNVNDGDGINAINYVNNVLIENNTIRVIDKAFYFTGFNGDIDENSYTFTFKNNDVYSNTMGIFQWSFGGRFISNTINNAGINLDAINNFVIDGNTILKGNLQIGNSISDNIIIKNNTIESEQDAINSDNANSIENKNIVIDNNILRSTSQRHWGGVNISGFNGITVINNTGYSGPYGAFIQYRGDNSTFTNNKTETGEISNDIQGNNNTIN